WYSQGWNRMLAGNAPRLFNYEHQVFVYFAGYGEGQPGWRHLKDETDFLQALKGPGLPAVCFIKPTDRYDMHPGLGTVVDGERQVTEVVSVVQRSPYWRDSAIVITYDENGGRWDHVAPPVVDRWGPGARVPALVISPLAKRGHVE